MLPRLAQDSQLSMRIPTAQATDEPFGTRPRTTAFLKPTDCFGSIAPFRDVGKLTFAPVSGGLTSQDFRTTGIEIS